MCSTPTDRVVLDQQVQLVFHTIAAERGETDDTVAATIADGHERLTESEQKRGGATGEKATDAMMAQCLSRPRTPSLWCTSCASSYVASAH